MLYEGFEVQGAAGKWLAMTSVHQLPTLMLVQCLFRFASHLSFITVRILSWQRHGDQSLSRLLRAMLIKPSAGEWRRRCRGQPSFIALSHPSCSSPNGSAIGSLYENGP